jgi:hypothetical protein
MTREPKFLKKHGRRKLISKQCLKETKKKLKTPTPYTGKREDLRKFLQEVRLYLLANKEAYQTDLDKILFVISYMSEGDASSWKEEFVDTADQKAAQDGTPFTLGTYDDFIKLVTKDFSPYDAPKDAIHEMKEMTMGNTPIEEHVAKFKMLVTKSKLAKNDAVAEYFRETLPVALQKRNHETPRPTNRPQRLVQMGDPAPEQFHPHEKCDSKDTSTRRPNTWTIHHPKCKETSRQNTPSVLLRTTPTQAKQRSKRDGHRLHVRR